MKNKVANRVLPYKDTVFSEMTALANRYDAINLGQGFPDFETPDFVKDAAKKSIDKNLNQYAPSLGVLPLRKSISDKLARFYGFEANPENEIIVTNGATEALFASIFSVVDPDDEVIVFEPFFDTYVPAINMAGGIPKYYTITADSNWEIDFNRFESLFTSKTKMVLINTPHNPTGKVFSKQELNRIAELCVKYDVIALVDEVYEHIVFDGCMHHFLAAFPGMKERTISISSLGKTFSVTGWKVGWAVSSKEIVSGIVKMHQFMTFCGATPLQSAAADAIICDDGFYLELTDSYQRKREILYNGLEASGLKPILPDGTFFIMTDLSGLGFKDDVDFCKYLTINTGVTAIPPSAFYSRPEKGANLARFAFCKRDEVLKDAVVRLKRFSVKY